MVFIHGMTWTYICVRPWITLFLMLSYRTHRRACTPNATITTTSVNFKKLKGDWGSMSLTHVFWEMCAFSVQTPLWPFHTWFETPINSRVSLSEKYPISCRCHVVGCLSAKFLPRHEVTARLYQKQKGLQKRLCWLSHGRCDSDMWYYFREPKFPDRWRGRNMIEYGIVKGDYPWRLWNVSAANQIKSRIIPDGKKRETTKYESTNTTE